MLFHRRQDAKIALDTVKVVIGNVSLNHCIQLLLRGEASAIVTLAFQDSPEALHRAVVDAVRNAGHALSHAGLFQLVVKCSVSILETPVAVE